jgi:PAS domain S-box-containing protein
MPTAKLKAVPDSFASAVASVSATPELNSKYQAIFDQASDSIMTVFQNGIIDGANQAMEELTGYMKNELIGSSVDSLIPNVAKTSGHRARPLSKEMFSASGTYEDVVIDRKDGYSRFVDLNVRSISSGNSTLTLALFRDITAKKQMERELITKHTELRNAYMQLEKKNAELQAMQETLVQELNQPLQGIRGYAQELQAIATPIVKDNVAAPEIDASLREIVSNVDKMATIIGYLRSFTRKSTENHEQADVHQAIDEALKMLSRQFASRGITVERNFGKDVAPIYANPLQLEQVFINLATNARDAIDASGKGKGTIRIATRSAGKFIEILFKDDGVGMGERTRAKVFNPFFTTKEVGKGMGLGLSLSYGILSKLQGSIVVESELGKGAAFVIRIPKDFRELA